MRFRAPGWVDDVTVTQVVFPADEEGAQTLIELPDDAIQRNAPPGGRYAPMAGWLFARSAVNRWRERMRDRVAWGRTAEGPGWGGGGGAGGCGCGQDRCGLDIGDTHGCGWGGTSVSPTARRFGGATARDAVERVVLGPLTCVTIR